MQKLRPKTGKSCAVSGFKVARAYYGAAGALDQLGDLPVIFVLQNLWTRFLRFRMRPSRTLADTLHSRSHCILSPTTAKIDLSVAPFSENWKRKCAMPRSRRVPSFLKAQFAKYTIVFEFVLLRCSRVCVRPSNVWFWHVQKPT